MEQTAIFAPALALVGWTLLVLLLIPFRRFQAAFAGTVTAHDFRFGESANVPPQVSIPNRNYMNLLEAPLLFYVLCLVLFQLQGVGQSALVLAWAYVGCRVAHSLVHLTYNRVMHRLGFFALSNVLLTVLFFLAVAALAG